MLSDHVVSVIRTLVPVLVGSLLAWAARQGLPADAGFAQPLTEVLVFVFSGAYYLLARWAEKKWPDLGWLLGVPKQPAYPEPPPPPPA